MKRYIRMLALVLVTVFLLTGCKSGNGDEKSDAPVPAAAAEYQMTELVFHDDFDDESTIDWDATGDKGYKWYVDRPFGWEAFTKEEATVKDSVLTLKPNASHANWSISSYSAKGDTGSAFRYAYFEARIRIDVDKNKENTPENGFPAWWSFSVDHTTDRNDERWGEIDFFEAMFNSKGVYSGALVTSVHDHYRDEEGAAHNRQNNNHWHDGLVTEGWHTYGCLWASGEIHWYYDGEKIGSVQYSADGFPMPWSNSTVFEGCYSILDQEMMHLVLGTGPSWPMEVDWVRVWQSKE